MPQGAPHAPMCLGDTRCREDVSTADHVHFASVCVVFVLHWFVLPYLLTCLFCLGTTLCEYPWYVSNATLDNCILDIKRTLLILFSGRKYACFGGSEAFHDYS